MKTLNTKLVLKNFKGETLKIYTDMPETTIGDILANILSGDVSNHSLGYQLGKKIATEDKVDLKAEEVVFIKKELIGKDDYKPRHNFTAIVTGQILEELEKSDK